MVETLIQHGILVDKQDQDGFTALMFAVRTKNINLVKYFVQEKRANMNVQNNVSLQRCVYDSVFF